MEWHKRPELPIIIAGLQKGREAKGSFTMGWPKGFHQQKEFEKLLTSSDLSEINQQKTIWDLRDDVVEPNHSSSGSYNLIPTIVRVDQWGNMGDESGTNDPDPIPSEAFTPTVTGSSVLSVTSQAALIIEDSNVEQPSEQGFISVTGSNVLSVSSMETLVIRDSNVEQSSDQEFISVTGATVLSVTSATEVTEETIVDLPMQGSDGQVVFVDSTTGKTYTNNGVVSILNNEAVFNGSSYLSASDGFSLGSDFEISFDVKVDSFANHAGYFLFGDESQDSLRVQLSSNTSNSLTFFASDASGSTAFSAAAGNSALSTGVYHNIKCQKIGSDVSLFVDGVLKASTSYSGAPATFSDRVNIGIARSSSTQRFLNGKIKNFVTKVFT